MDQQELRKLLQQVSAGEVPVEEAALKLKTEPFEELGFAKPDHHRGIRQGVPEVIYGAGKTTEQIIQIAGSLKAHGQKTIIATRLEDNIAEEIQKELPLTYYPVAKIGRIGEIPQPSGNGKVMIVTGGTSDLPVAEEAALTAEFLGNDVVRLYDVGVAGIHRLLANTELLMQAQVVIAVAGMEGALASVVGGLVACPVIAVPTSIGYGASFGGLSALLSMLNSCASGVSVVNIDNGFGAGYQASVINHLGVKR